MKIRISVMAVVMMMVGISKCAADSNDIKAVGPAAFKVSCGDVLIRIDGPMKWTINRIEYKGTPLWIENSACGTVFRFPGIGDIGTGHLVARKNGAEDVLKLQSWLDGNEISWPTNKSFSSSELQLCLNGKPLPSSVELVKGNEFKQHKISRILDFDLDCIIKLQDNRLYEETTISTSKQIPLELVYNFTHAWASTMTAFLSGKDGGEEISGQLSDSNVSNYVNKDMDWVALYDVHSGKGIVSRLLAKPQVGGAVMFIRNCPKIYRKFHMMSFAKDTVPAGFKGTYKIVTGFFEATPENWQPVARKIAVALKMP